MSLLNRWKKDPSKAEPLPDSEPQASVAVEEARPASTEPTPVRTLTVDEMMEVMKAFAAELRKPTEAELAKQSEEEIKRQRINEARIEVGRAAEAERIDRQKRCNHRMNNGTDPKLSVNGQIFSDGMVRLMCTNCQKFVKEFPATPNMHGVYGG